MERWDMTWNYQYKNTIIGTRAARNVSNHPIYIKLISGTNNKHLTQHTAKKNQETYNQLIHPRLQAKKKQREKYIDLDVCNFISLSLSY